MRQCDVCAHFKGETLFAVRGRFSICKTCQAERDARSHCCLCGTKLTVATRSLYRDKRAKRDGYQMRPWCKTCWNAYNRNVRRRERSQQMVS
jgi:FPC/CPF motif-containing protein YcgG